MKRIKQGVTLLLCLCMALSLCACGGKKDTAKDAKAETRTDAPVETKKETPASDGPLPLSQYIHSSETQILYKGSKMDKDAKPSVYLFQDGTVTTANLKLTFGELSKMSDEEIIQAVSTAEGIPYGGPCLVYLETGSSGNTVKSEILWHYNANDQSIGKMEFGGGFSPYSGVIYDSTYTGFSNLEGTFYVARGEQAPFSRDDLSTEGIEIDPNNEKKAEMRRSIARIELVDGTQVSPPETSGDVTITSCALTGDGRRTLSVNDVHFAVSDPDTDFSPSVLNTAEGRAALTTGEAWWVDPESYDYSNYHSIYSIDIRNLPPTPAGEILELTYIPMGNRIIFYNDSDTEQSLQNLKLGGIIVNTGTGVEARTGTWNSPDIDNLILEYGVPSSAAMIWNDVRAEIVYCWPGDGFYILGSENRSPLYLSSSMDELTLGRLTKLYGENYIQACKEAVRLASN